MLRLKHVIVAAIVALVLFALAFAGLLFVPGSGIYMVASEYTVAPETDDDLEAWLRVQPGVVGRTVDIVRKDTKPPKLVLSILIVRNGWGYPRFPDVEAKASELGYELADEGFVDVKGPERFE